MQSQPNRQEPSSYSGAHPPSVTVVRPDSMTAAGITQSATPYNNLNTQPLTHGQTPVPFEPGLGLRNDMYRGGVIPGYEFNYSMAGSSEVPAPQALGHSGYMMPSVQYSNVEHGGTNHGSHDFTAIQISDPTAPFPHLLPGAYTAPNNQGTFPVWRLHNVWVSYAVQDELHVTVVFRRIRSV